MKHHSKPRTETRWGWVGLAIFPLFVALVLAPAWLVVSTALAGELVLRVESEPSPHQSQVAEESSAAGEASQEIAAGGPTIARLELVRPQRVANSNRPKRSKPASPKPLSIRKTVSAGWGVVVDQSVTLSLPEGPYEFRLTRGPEYRVLRGQFAIERDSQDDHFLKLPRILSMLKQGWTSGDCYVPPSPESLAMRMASEDLHLAMVVQTLDQQKAPVSERPVPGRKMPSSLGSIELTPPSPEHLEAWPLRPIFIDRSAVDFNGLVIYPNVSVPNGELATPNTIAEASSDSDATFASLNQLARLAKTENEQPQGRSRVAVENPFAWPLPVWLASGRIDGMFVLGDWLRLDRQVLQPSDGRPLLGEAAARQAGDRDALSLGRDAEQIYWHALNVGLRIAPLAGCGDQGTSTPVGYNRLYVAGVSTVDPYDNSRQQPVPVTSSAAWWKGAWAGNSVATNGPLMQPSLQGKLPGYVFEIRPGEKRTLTPEVTLTVRDPVDYLEVIHNGSVHYSARLDEYAKAGGRIPAMEIDSPGWALIRVVTLYEGHFRAATSAPWYFQVNGQEHVNARSVKFFQQWLSDYETRLRKLPPQQLAAYAPFIRAARRYWEQKAEDAH